MNHPPAPLPSSRHDPPAKLAPRSFQPRHDYVPVGESEPSGPRQRWGLVGMAFILGLLVNWGFQRLTAPPPRPLTPTSAPLSPADTGPPPRRPADDPAATVLVNQALRAEKGGDVGRAVELFTAAAKASPGFPGIDYRLALLALRRGEIGLARARLANSLASGEEVAAAHNLQSALARLEDQPELAFTELEAATRADPFNPKYFYFWAEALRRVGRLPEAATRMEDALARTTEPTEESLYQLKLRLVKIDLAQEADFTAELGARLAGKDGIPPEWLLTAAALDLKRGDYRRAAGLLERARQLLSPATANFLLNDQIFRDNSWRPELAPLYSDAAVVRPSPPSVNPPTTVGPEAIPTRPAAPPATRPRAGS